MDKADRHYLNPVGLGCGFAPAHDSSSRWLDLVRGPSSQSLLSALADPAKLSASVERDDFRMSRDATTPDITARSFRVQSVDAAKSAILGACRAAGLSPPSSSDMKTMPDIICQGEWRGADATVHFSSRCQAGCLAMLEVSLI